MCISNHYISETCEIGKKLRFNTIYWLHDELCKATSLNIISTAFIKLRKHTIVIHLSTIISKNFYV